MKSFYILTRDCSGTTLYSLGLFASRYEAIQAAKSNFKWYNVEYYPIVIRGEMKMTKK